MLLTNPLLYVTKTPNRNIRHTDGFKKFLKNFR